MPVRLEHVEVGTRVAYEDAANPRREGRVVEILEDGLDYVVEWDEASRFPATEGVFEGGPTDRVHSDLRQHGWTIIADLPGSFFDGADVIDAYTRTDAIRDGVLVPVIDLVPDEPDFAREAGFAVAVDLTASVAELVRRGDVKGRLWDVLRLAAINGARVDSDRFEYVVRIGRRTLRLKAVIGPDSDGSRVLTIMLPEED